MEPVVEKESAAPASVEPAAASTSRPRTLEDLFNWSHADMNEFWDCCMHFPIGKLVEENRRILRLIASDKKFPDAYIVRLLEHLTRNGMSMEPLEGKLSSSHKETYTPLWKEVFLLALTRDGGSTTPAKTEESMRTVNRAFTIAHYLLRGYFVADEGMIRRTEARAQSLIPLEDEALFFSVLHGWKEIYTYLFQHQHRTLDVSHRSWLAFDIAQTPEMLKLLLWQFARTYMHTAGYPQNYYPRERQNCEPPEITESEIKASGDDGKRIWRNYRVGSGGMPIGFPVSGSDDYERVMPFAIIAPESTKEGRPQGLAMTFRLTGGIEISIDIGTNNNITTAAPSAEDIVPSTVEYYEALFEDAPEPVKVLKALKYMPYREAFIEQYVSKFFRERTKKRHAQTMKELLASKRALKTTPPSTAPKRRAGMSFSVSEAMLSSKEFQLD